MSFSLSRQSDIWHPNVTYIFILRAIIAYEMLTSPVVIYVHHMMWLFTKDQLQWRKELLRITALFQLCKMCNLAIFHVKVFCHDTIAKWRVGRSWILVLGVNLNKTLCNFIWLILQEFLKSLIFNKFSFLLFLKGWVAHSQNHSSAVNQNKSAEFGTRRRFGIADVARRSSRKR